MTPRPIARTFRNVDDSLAWMDLIFEDKLRAFRTALLTDIPRRGVDVDHDAAADLIEDNRREWAVQREEIRRELLKGVGVSVPSDDINAPERLSLRGTH